MYSILMQRKAVSLLFFCAIFLKTEGSNGLQLHEGAVVVGFGI